MPETISFTIPGEPVAWQRRVVTKAGQQFTPAKMRKRMAEVRWLFDQAAPGWKPHEGPVSLIIHAHLMPAKSWPKWRRDGLWRGWLEFRGCCKKPDASNILKLIEDALNRVAYRDDAQIWHEEMTTTWSRMGAPRTDAAVTFWDPPTRENAAR